MVGNVQAPLSEDFYLQDTITVSKKLLGKNLFNKRNSTLGMIVETEAYCGEKDKACHTFGGRTTDRTSVLYQQGGTAYIYQIYGLYFCLNVVTREAGVGEAVLIRACEPLNGLEEMKRNRTNRKTSKQPELRNLTSGPGKLCQAMDINTDYNKSSLITGVLRIYDNKTIEEQNIVSAKRIGVEYAEEAKDFLYRFYIKGNMFVSK